MEIKGVIYKILELQSGTGAKGDWTKQEVVIETEGQYPKKVCISAFNKVADSMDSLTEGMEVTAYVNPESREYNNRWYTELQCWKFVAHGAKKETAKPVENVVDDNTDDLPF